MHRQHSVSNTHTRIHPMQLLLLQHSCECLLGLENGHQRDSLPSQHYLGAQQCLPRLAYSAGTPPSCSSYAINHSWVCEMLQTQLNDIMQQYRSTRSNQHKGQGGSRQVSFSSKHSSTRGLMQGCSCTAARRKTRVVRGGLSNIICKLIHRVTQTCTQCTIGRQAALSCSEYGIV
jgi:hypothetical protein